MQESEIDIIRKLRRIFLDAGEEDGASVPDYWRDRATLEAYDGFPAARIGWKWDAVLDELEAKSLLRPVETVLDWGCGTGVASRRLVRRAPVARVLLFDRSPLAARFAAERLRNEAPDGPAVECLATGAETAEPDLMLVSHVLDELDADGLAQLIVQVQRSHRVIWVEPGSRLVSRQLSRIRDRLQDEFAVVAPCPHQEPCSALAASERDWCHFFARPPAGAFRDGALAKKARALGVDLRALPYHFLHLVRRNATETKQPASPSRLLGRPEVRAKEATVVQCEPGGLRVRIVRKSADPELWRTLKKHPEKVRDLPP